MLNSIEIRPAKNGIIVIIRNDEEEDVEYVYDKPSKAIKILKEILEKEIPTSKP